MKKSTKAITLIALIITIIVLLILAGVTINMVLGDNGLFNKAKTSENEYVKSQTLEEMRLKTVEVQIEKKGKGTLKDLVEYLENDNENEYIISLERIASLKYPIIGDIDTAKEIFVIYKDYQFKIDDALNVEFAGEYSGNYVPQVQEDGSETDFEYRGSVQVYEVLDTGYYLLEVWGAQGGHSTGFTYGELPKGGYSKGIIRLNRGEELYICVGGNGQRDGYNGGTPPTAYGGAGGGATHIARYSNRGTLEHYVDNKDEVLIVAGGGAGVDNWTSGYDGTGGGLIGGEGAYYNNKRAKGGTQTAGGEGDSPGTFGKGGLSYGGSDPSAGGRRRLVRRR